jgi:hypothetical protein
LSVEQQDVAFKSLTQVQTRKTFTTYPAHIESELKVGKKIYVLSELDKAILPEMQEGFAKIGGFDEVVRVPAGHSPFLSMPDRVLEIIKSAHEV